MHLFHVFLKTENNIIVPDGRLFKLKQKYEGFQEDSLKFLYLLRIRRFSTLYNFFPRTLGERFNEISLYL